MRSGGGGLRAQHQAQRVAELGRVAPAQVAARHRRLPGGDELVARVAGIVRDGRVVAVDGVHQVPHHAVGVERRLVGGAQRHPLLGVLILDPLHLVHRAAAAVALGPGLTLDLLDHLREHQLGVADDRVVEVVVLVEVDGVDGALHHHLAAGDLSRGEVAGEARADAEDRVGLVEEVARHLGHRVGGRAQGERMVLGEGALAAVGRGDGGVEQFRERRELLAGLGPEDALAGEDHRALGREQRRDGVAHVGGIAGAAMRRDGAVVRDRRIGLFGAHVGGGLEQHGRAAAGAQEGVGAAQELGDAPRLVDLRAPLGDAAVVQRGAEVGVRPGRAAGRAAGQDEDRHRVGEGVRDAAVGVLDAGARLGDDDAVAAAVHHARVAVGHVDRRALGARHHGPDADRRRGLDQRVVRVAEEVLGALRLQDARDRVVASHAAPLHARRCRVGCVDDPMARRMAARRRG